MKKIPDIYSMEKNLYLNNPFSFNNLKHHLNHTKEYCKQIKPLFFKENEIKSFALELKCIGNNITDIYIGHLSICNIFEEIIYNLKENGRYDYFNYMKLFAETDYYKLELSDRSKWILRMGKEKEHYIHIHPGRIGDNTIRFAANAWKTAITCYCFKLCDPDFNFELNKINALRSAYLDLSPIKKLKEDGDICVAYKLLSENYF